MSTKYTEEKLEQVLTALTYAEENNLDIKNRGDVKKILIELKLPYDNHDIDEFMKILEEANLLFDLLDSKRRLKQKKEPN